MNKLLSAGMGIIVALCIYTSATAQVMWGPLATTREWVPGGSPVKVNGLNTAIIDYVDGSNTGQIVACAYYGLTGTGTNNFGRVRIKDLGNNLNAMITYPVSGGITMASTPDVAIGNNINSASPSTDFIMAVTFINNSGSSQIDFFDISNSGGVLSWSYVSTCALWTTTGVCVPLETVHIDPVADFAQNVSAPLYGTPGLPAVDRFFVTFDVDCSGPPGGYNVGVGYGSFSAYTVTAGPNLVSTPDRWRPDVAGVQAGLNSTWQDVALLTYVHQNAGPGIPTGALDVADWNPGTGMFNEAQVVAGTNDMPRIDANDYYDSSLLASQSLYKVAFNYLNSSPVWTTTEVNTYDPYGGQQPASDWMWPGGGGLSGVPYSGSTEHRAPTVAYGPSGMQVPQFMVTSCATDNSISTPQEGYFMEPIAENMPNAIAPDPGSSVTFFQVDAGGLSPTNAYDVNYANATSTPCNAVYDTNMVTWAYYDGSNYHIEFRTSKYQMTGNGYLYRPAPTVVAAGEAGVSLYPNPVTDCVKVGYSMAADSYTITDMAGRQVAQGKLSTGPDIDIDVHRLAPGSYYLSLQDCGVEKAAKKLVKQ